MHFATPPRVSVNILWRGLLNAELSLVDERFSTSLAEQANICPNISSAPMHMVSSKCVWIFPSVSYLAKLLVQYPISRVDS